VAKLGPARRTVDEHRLLRLVRSFRPEMVLALTRAFRPPVLASVKRAGVSHLVAWWGDPPANMRQMGLLAAEWDVVCFKDPDAVAKFRRVGVNAHLLFEAFNPAWHRPLASCAHDRVVVAGNFYAYRQFLVRKLFDAGVPMDLYGERLPRWVDPEIAKQHRGRAVFKEEKSLVFGEALACLNSMSIAEGNSLNCRAFEVAGAAGLQLIEHRPIIERAFEPGKEVLVFDSMDELLEHIKWARRFPGDAARVRQAGHRRALGEHTYEHRMRTLLELVTAR
jgi:spore maturation protein CgeB